MLLYFSLVKPYRLTVSLGREIEAISVYLY